MKLRIIALEVFVCFCYVFPLTLGLSLGMTKKYLSKEELVSSKLEQAAFSLEELIQSIDEEEENVNKLIKTLQNPVSMNTTSIKQENEVQTEEKREKHRREIERLKKEEFEKNKETLKKYGLYSVNKYKDDIELNIKDLDYNQGNLLSGILTMLKEKISLRKETTNYKEMGSIVPEKKRLLTPNKLKRHEKLNTQVKKEKEDGVEIAKSFSKSLRALNKTEMNIKRDIVEEDDQIPSYFFPVKDFYKPKPKPNGLEESFNETEKNWERPRISHSKTEKTLPNFKTDVIYANGKKYEKPAKINDDLFYAPRAERFITPDDVSTEANEVEYKHRHWKWKYVK